MDPRRKTGAENVRLPELSRRAVIAGTSVAAFGAVKPEAATGAILPTSAMVASDVGVRRCASWLAIDAKIARLQTRWAKLETWLAKEHAWFKLSPAEQQALPWAKELHDIDGCLDVLFEQREATLKSIPSSGSPDLEAVIAKLAVVERLIWREEYPEVHALITGARRDLTVISRQHSRLRMEGAHSPKVCDAPAA
ncbi:helicase [Phenylobacterium sp.]|uniref:helicase n=1 Tax=Phenylobacterium sp. TaxID=1871053 RepID=UPI003BAD80AE